MTTTVPVLPGTFGVIVDVTGAVAIPVRVAVTYGRGRSTITVPVSPGLPGCWVRLVAKETLPYRVVVVNSCGRSTTMAPVSLGRFGAWVLVNGGCDTTIPRCSNNGLAEDDNYCSCLSGACRSHSCRRISRHSPVAGGGNKELRHKDYNCTSLSRPAGILSTRDGGCPCQVW